MKPAGGELMWPNSPPIGRQSPEAEHQRRRVIRLLLRWGRQNRREFPWRNEPDPFRILIAELLLQRSRSSTVTKVYVELFRRWPSPARLARADTLDIAEVIRPLGLVGRASRIRALAGAVDRRGDIPKSRKGLRMLPGVGEYVASATMSAAYGSAIPVVDSVSARVYSRVYLAATISRGGEAEPAFRSVVEWATPRSSARDWNWAVLDLAATVCLPVRPRCGECPLQPVCSYASNTGESS